MRRVELVVMWLSGCWMSGIGIRMVVQHFFGHGQLYNPVLFDALFDWAPMAILGILSLYISLSEAIPRLIRRWRNV